MRLQHIQFCLFQPAKNDLISNLVLDCLGSVGALIRMEFCGCRNIRRLCPVPLLSLLLVTRKDYSKISRIHLILVLMLLLFNQTILSADR